MPLRKRTLRSRNLNQHDIEVLRTAIREGVPWLLHQKDNQFRSSGLDIRHGILLSYVTHVLCGPGVFLAGEEHPSREIVEAVRAELADDIAVAEKRYRKIFTGRHYPESFSAIAPNRSKNGGQVRASRDHVH